MIGEDKINQLEYNIYCDESCHLEKDQQRVMVLGAIWCPGKEVKAISQEIRRLKQQYNARGELKWIKVSKSRLAFYCSLVDYFFKTPSLNFRCLVVDDKSKLNHGFFNQGDHDTFYYKMYFSLLSKILDPISRYSIYLDIKDTRSQHKITELKNILCNNIHDFTQQMIEKIQQIRSHESELLQLADFFAGAVCYKNKGLIGNKTKGEIVSRIEAKIGKKLIHSTSLYEKKFNIFVFSPMKILQ
ncbi:MAG: DUF3800 domain-containing protein [Armatimonadetes bacterium]|nr:DUF3800 domain-containing protein [Armatimonadota bacterium]